MTDPVEAQGMPPLSGEINQALLDWRESALSSPGRTSACMSTLSDAIHAYARAYGDARAAAERERCAKVCEDEHVGASVDDECDNEGDGAYNQALRDAAAAIRATTQEGK